MNKRFLLGVGCQKGGTTWMYEYLVQHPQADPGISKGHHIFDGLFIDDMQPAFRARIGKLIAYLQGEGPPTDRSTLRSASFLFDIEAYFDHFHYLLLRSPAVRLTADLTPDYCALPVEALTMIRDGFAARGVPVKVLFILRDPVERCWSHARMLRRQDADAGKPEAYPSAEAHLRAAYASDLFSLRTRYDHTLARLSRVFPADDVHLVLYEQLFTEAEMRRLSAFLGVDHHAVDLSRRVHVTPSAPPLPESLLDDIARFYEPVYEAARARFGRDTIAAHWPHAHRVEPVHA